MKKSLGARTLIYPLPVLVIGTYDKQGKPDVMTASWGGIASSEPPCVAVSVRQQTLSYQNLMDRKAFTISIPSQQHVKEVDYIGLVSGRNTDKLASAKLTAVKSKMVDAPYLKEFPLILECRVIHLTNLGMHTQFIGEVLDTKVDDHILGADGSVDVKKLRPLVYMPDTQQYFGIGEFIANVFSAGKTV
jgi:flavin reductase (DIM6/NTAB) family NADH-FMN oxidoreductase RutF